MDEFCFILDFLQIWSLVVLPETSDPLRGHNPAQGCISSGEYFIRFSGLLLLWVIICSHREMSVFFLILISRLS